MISREVKVASYKEICGGEKKRVNFGYNNDPLIINVENNKLLHKPLIRDLKGTSSVVSQDWEVLSTFISFQNIEPNWLDCDWSWGYYDEEQGAWTGCVGKV